MSHQDADRYEVHSEPSKKRSTSKKRPEATKKKSTLDDRPPWNDDTNIEGYENVDENGRIRHKSVVSQDDKNRLRIQQEELNRTWTDSLRGQAYANDK